jgi:hypothetical protein
MAAWFSEEEYLVVATNLVPGLLEAPPDGWIMKFRQVLSEVLYLPISMRAQIEGLTSPDEKAGWYGRINDILTSLLYRR